MVIYHICCSSWKIFGVNEASYPLSNAEHQYSCTPIESISVIISSGQRIIIFDFRRRNGRDFFYCSQTLQPKAHSQYEPALRSEELKMNNLMKYEMSNEKSEEILITEYTIKDLRTYRSKNIP